MRETLSHEGSYILSHIEISRFNSAVYIYIYIYIYIYKERLNKLSVLCYNSWTVINLKMFVRIQ